MHEVIERDLQPCQLVVAGGRHAGGVFQSLAELADGAVEHDLSRPLVHAVIAGEYCGGLGHNRASLFLLPPVWQHWLDWSSAVWQGLLNYFGDYMPPIRRTRNTAAERVADKFGGFAALAGALGINRNTPIHWTERGGYIPSRWHKPILAAAKKRRIRLAVKDLVHT